MLAEGDRGKAQLPADQHAGFDAVRTAFAAYEKGNDEAAREALNAVGLSSPFLEWKVLLRGLMAWSAGDDARAAENWLRLTPGRLPAKMAAPCRFATDPSFRAAVPAAEAGELARQGDAVLGASVEPLRRVQKLINAEEGLPELRLREVVPVADQLKKANPAAFRRLANVCYWAIANGGYPEDLARYAKAFGPPPDDPNFHRLQATVMEATGRRDDAQRQWAKYEAWIASAADRWPGPQAARACADVLMRMGTNALAMAEKPDEDDLDAIFDFFGRPRDKARVKGAKPAEAGPSAADCFGRAADLVPGWMPPNVALMGVYALGDREVEGRALAAKLIETFPNDLAALNAAAGFYERTTNSPPP